MSKCFENKNIGITFGGYCPLHQGHLELIMRAKKENDYCFVVVCGYDNEPRANEIGLNLNKRFQLVKEFFKDDEQVIVVKIDDSVLGIDESMSDNNWEIWLDAVTKQLERFDEDIVFIDKHNHFTFYVSEQNYKDSIDSRKNSCDTWTHSHVICENCVLVDRNENPISGTVVRENPLKYWSKIAKPFRRYMTKNVLIVGTASEGKTTLCKDISRYFGIPCTEEYGRLYMEKHNMLDTDLTFNDFREFLIGQIQLTQKAIEETATGIIIADTDNLITLMYAKAYINDHNISLSYEDYCVLESLALSLQSMIKWDKIFFVTPGNDFVDDGTRYMTQSSIEEREKNADILKGLLCSFEMIDKVSFLDGSYIDNFNAVKKYINELYN